MSILKVLSFTVISQIKVYLVYKWDSSVAIGTGYWLHRREIWVRFQTEARDLSLLYSVQTGSGAHPVPSGYWSETAWVLGKSV
jgi:hypothetical protein